MTAISDSNVPDAPRSQMYYRHSGRAPLASIVLALAFGAAISAPAAAIYSLGIVYIPFVYARALLCVGLGAALGAGPAIALRWGRARSNFLSVAVALLIAAVGYYFSWVAWIWALCLKSGVDIRSYTVLFEPRAIGAAISAASESGTFTLGHDSGANGDAVTGPFLWAIWLAEAAAIFGFAVAAAKRTMGSQPFCEACVRWAGKARRLGTADYQNVNELRTRLESGDFTSVTPLDPAATTRTPRLDFYHHTCSGCGQLNTLSIKLVAATQGRKKRTKIKARTVINKLLLHPGEAEQLLTAPPNPFEEKNSEPQSK